MTCSSWKSFLSLCWKSAAFFLLLGFRLTASLEEVDWLPKPNASSCFQYDSPPTCDALEGSEAFLQDYSIREECFSLAIYIWGYGVLWEPDRHVDALAEILVDTPECEVAKQVYHKCLWCLPPDSEYYEDREEFCLLEDDPCVIPDEVDPDIDFAAACDELYTIFVEEWSWPVSLEMCYHAETVIHACDWYCLDGNRNPAFGGAPSEDSCWTMDDPPSCTGDDVVPLEDLPVDLDLEAECWHLYRLMPDTWYQANAWTHVYSFADILAGTDSCTRARLAYPHCQMCHPLQEGNQGFCELYAVCDDAGHRKPMVKDPLINMRETCEYLHEKMEINQSIVITLEDCHLAEMSLHACEFWCEQPYLGANTAREKWTLVWLARASAGLSLLGACFIVHDVVWQKKNRHTVYHQLLLAMAIFDIITAIAWSFSTAPLPVDEAWKVVGAVGNDTTCTAQAFFIQLGLTSIFYNTSLALYYVLVIVYRWREDDLKKIRPYMHAGPLVVGVVLACFLIPYADWTGYGCHILPPPDDAQWKSLIFVVIPLGFSVASITVGMGYVYYVVRQNARASRKQSNGIDSRQRLETQVFWQSLLYTMSFYVTWPIMFAVYLASVDYKSSSFVFTAVVSFVAPLQGFSNFAVYVRPRILRFFQVQARGFSSHSSSFSPNSTTVASCNLDPSVRAARNPPPPPPRRPVDRDSSYRDSAVHPGEAVQDEVLQDEAAQDEADGNYKTVRLDPPGIVLGESAPPVGPKHNDDGGDDIDPYAKIALLDGLKGDDTGVIVTCVNYHPPPTDLPDGALPDPTELSSLPVVLEQNDDGDDMDPSAKIALLNDLEGEKTDASTTNVNLLVSIDDDSSTTIGIDWSMT